MAKSGFFILFAAFLASSASADPCPQDGSSNNPLGANSDTVSTVAQATQSPEKKKRIQVTISGQGSSGAPKTVFVDVTTSTYAIMANPKDPQYVQTVADFNSAFNAYLTATDQATCPANTKVCGPQTYSDYLGYLKTQANSLNLNSKTIFGSMLLGNGLADLYKSNRGITPLPTMFQALITKAQNAGECRDIHTFIAASLGALGLKCGVIGADWNNGSITGAHDIATCKDPKTGKYTAINYGDAFGSGATNISTEAQKISLNLNPYSTAIQVQSQVDPATGKGALHEEQGPRTQQIQNTIDQASDPDSPNVQVALGNNESSIGAHAGLGDDKNNVGVYGTGLDNRQGDSYDMLSGGARVDLGKEFTTSDKTAVNLSFKTKDGVLYVRDQTPAGDTNSTGVRSTTAYFTNTSGGVNFGWNEKGQGGNSGHVGVEGNMQDSIYAKGGFGAGNVPYDTISLVAVDNPTQHIQIHFTNTGFISNVTAQDIHIGYHQADAATGVKFTKAFNDGKIAVSNDVTYHYFGQGNYGLTEAGKLTFKTARFGNWSVGAKVGYVHSSGTDDYYIYPTTGKFDVSWEKQWGRATLNLNGEYNLKQYNAFNQFHLDDPDGLITPPKERVNFFIRF